MTRKVAGRQTGIKPKKYTLGVISYLNLRLNKLFFFQAVLTLSTPRTFHTNSLVTPHPSILKLCSACLASFLVASGTWSFMHPVHSVTKHAFCSESRRKSWYLHGKCRAPVMRPPHRSLMSLHCCLPVKVLKSRHCLA